MEDCRTPSINQTPNLHCTADGVLLRMPTSWMTLRRRNASKAISSSNILGAVSIWEIAQDAADALSQDE